MQLWLLPIIEMGFGEQMRQVSLHFVPTLILSRQVGVTMAEMTLT